MKNIKTFESFKMNIEHEISEEVINTKKVQEAYYTLTYYTLTYYYMIGDDNGYTEESVSVSKDNPYLERYVKVLNKLKSYPGVWGVILDESRMHKHVEDGQITEEECEFICTLMFEEFESEHDTPLFEFPKEHLKYIQEFSDGVRSDTEYSFLVFEGIELEYEDEYGKTHKVEIED